MKTPFRIQGELTSLGHRITASTVWQILHAAGIDAAPRRSGPPRREFLTAQAKGAADSVHIDTALGKRLHALAFLEHGTRRLHISGITVNPTREWTVQQARHLAADLACAWSPCGSCCAIGTASTARHSTPSSSPRNWT